MIKAENLSEADSVLDSKEKKMFSLSPLWTAKILFWIMWKPKVFWCRLLYKYFSLNKEMQWRKQQLLSAY